MRWSCTVCGLSTSDGLSNAVANFADEPVRSDVIEVCKHGYQSTTMEQKSTYHQTTVLLRMIVSTERRVRSLHSRIVVRATTDTTDQRRQLIQFYSLTKHNLQTTHNPAGATARTAIRLTRATQSPLRTPAGNRLQTSSARVQDFLLNISNSRVNTHSHTVSRLLRQPYTACLLDRVLHHCFSHTGFPQTAL